MRNCAARFHGKRKKLPILEVEALRTDGYNRSHRPLGCLSSRRVAAPTSEGTQEVQDRLLIAGRQNPEFSDYCRRFRRRIVAAAIGGVWIAVFLSGRVRRDSRQQIVRPAVVQEEKPLAYTPERRCAEHIAL